MDFLGQAALDARALYNAEFSEPIMISDGSENTVQIRGVVDMTHQEVDPEMNTIVMSTKPRVSLWLPDIPWALKAGHFVTMRGKRFVIRDIEQQGDLAQDGAQGSAILILNPA